MHTLLPTPSAATLRAYRLVCLFVLGLLLSAGLLYGLSDVPITDPIGLRLAMTAFPLSVLAGSYFSGWLRRRIRAAVYAMLVPILVWIVWLAVVNAYAPAVFVGLMFTITALGLSGGTSSHSTRPVEGSLTVTTGALVAGLFLTPGVEAHRLFYAAALVGNALFVYVVARSRILAKARLADERERYRSIVERASDGIYLADAETYRFLDANAAYLDLVGYTLDELRALTVPEVVDTGADLLPVEDIVTLLLEQQTHHIGPRRHRCKSGACVDVDVNASVIYLGGRAVLCVIVRDATEQRRVEREMAAARARAESARHEAETARARAEELLHTKTALLRNMSHEIRTPLTGILGYADLLDQNVEGENGEFVEVIRKSAHRLLATLNSVLDLAQIEGGAVRLQPTSLDLTREAEATLQAVQPLADEKRLTLSLQAPPALPVEMDAGAVGRILTNLVGNAIKFTPAGYVQVAVAAHESPHPHVRITVADSGIGIAPGDRDRIFSEFAQGSEGVGRSHEGNGLGLAITRRLVGLMGGTIELQSRPGHGSTFTVRLPAAPAGDRSAGPGPVALRPAAAAA